MSPTRQTTSREMPECIEQCLSCHAVCVQTTAHCLELGGKHAAAEHIRRLQDCAQACTTSADFMLRGSDLHPRTCAVCADACRACAEDCERLAGDDQMMRDCAEECRRCEASCRRMAA